MESPTAETLENEPGPLEAMLKEQMAAVHAAALRALARAAEVSAEHPATEARYLREAARLMHLFVRQTEALDRRERARERAARGKGTGAEARADEPADPPPLSTEEPTEWHPIVPREIDPDWVPQKYERARLLPQSEAEQALEAALQETAKLLAVEAKAVTPPRPRPPGYERRPEPVHVALRSLSPFAMELKFANATGRELTPRERGVAAVLQATGRKVAERLVAAGTEHGDRASEAPGDEATHEVLPAA